MNEEALDDRLARFETARSWSPRLLSRLETHIRSADDEVLFRINPFTFARERNLREDEVIDRLLHAMSRGLFGTDWQLLCPKCTCVVRSLRKLETVHKRLSGYRQKTVLSGIRTQAQLARLASISLHSPRGLDVGKRRQSPFVSVSKVRHPRS
ncbi:MAG TPA: DUF5939 domain-containing protein [Reyranella sp.]